MYTRDGFELNTFQELVDAERIFLSLNGEVPLNLIHILNPPIARIHAVIAGPLSRKAFREPQRFSSALESEESTTSEADAIPAPRVQLRWG